MSIVRYLTESSIDNLLANAFFLFRRNANKEIRGLQMCLIKGIPLGFFWNIPFSSSPDLSTDLGQTSDLNSGSCSE